MIIFHSSNHKMHQALLSRRNLWQIQLSVPENGIIQQVYRVGKICCRPIYHLREEMSVGQMYRHQLRGQHSSAGMPQPELHIHKAFKGMAARGKCSLYWFYGFKLYLICNDKGGNQMSLPNILSVLSKHYAF